ncbi:MAG TPA: alkaline phosphatase [Candidatus Amulumruptor caecigallinarius]|uniref:Alkaline phosphatase n=1 Tax=Candidatus Amulumruptor caecigallinarius TaxID=2109911 RepID=A0A921E9L7_9BACT|nr:alkaline phosphatase [Candidatus Amulumruptor caecigallinarius]
MRKSSFLKSSVVAAAMCSAVAAMAGDAKYIFYFIGDGMGAGHAMATESYMRDIRKADMPLMLTFPVTGLVSTYSASSPVTDSAAAGTALSTGSKTRNSMLGMAADTTEVYSIARALKQDGYGIGIVTNVAPDDATPGAFYAHVPERHMYYEIGCQAAASGYEFIAGSNWRGLRGKDGKPTDLPERFASAGYVTVRGTAGLDTVTSGKIVMLCTDSIASDLGYTIDRKDPQATTLVDMTRACLAQMQRVSPDKFFMMVEGGNIDWAGHANDAATIIKEVAHFNDALALAYEFYEKHPDETLIVVTADHETGGMGLGTTFTGYNMRLDLIDHQKKSKDIFNQEIEAMIKSRRIYTFDDIKEKLTEDFGMYTAIPVNEEQDGKLREAFNQTFVDRNSGKRTVTYYKSYSPFVMETFRILGDHYGIGFTTGEHTGCFVPLYAVGVGAQSFTGFYDNTQVPVKILNQAER